MMRILHILDHSIPLHSGYTFRTRSILEQQRKLGWETLHVTSPKHWAESPPDEETIDGFHFYRTNKTGKLRERLPVLGEVGLVRDLTHRLEAIIKTHKPDILHAHSPALNGMAALRAGRRHGLPVVYECRAFWEDASVDRGTHKEGSLRYRMTRMMESYVFKHADAVTTICEGLRSEIVSRGVDAEKVVVIPNAVDSNRFEVLTQKNEKLLSELGLKDRVVLGFIGSFFSYEGLSELISALPEILQQTPKARVLLVGGGPDEAALKAQVERLQLGSKVIFTGRVPHDQVTDYYSLVDIFAYPRLPMRLTELVTPLKPLEAMAQGRLVIASDVGGHRELIENGRTGWLFESGNPSALADCVRQVLAVKDQWDTMKQNARQFVETERNWAASVSRYEQVYKRITGGGGPSRLGGLIEVP